MDCHELLTIAKREIAKSSAGIVEVNWELSAAIILYQLAKDETGRKNIPDVEILPSIFGEKFAEFEPLIKNSYMLWKITAPYSLNLQGGMPKNNAFMKAVLGHQTLNQYPTIDRKAILERNLTVQQAIEYNQLGAIL
jgi:hypothetical protein